MVASGLETKTVSGREDYPMLLAPIGALHFGLAHPHGPPSGDWIQAFHQVGHLIWQPWTQN